MPDIDTQTIASLVAAAQDRAQEISGGKLRNFSPSSPVTAILEGVAVIGEQVISKVNDLAGTLEANRIAVFGIERRLGAKALGTIEVGLDALYSDSFFLARGFRLSLDGIEFETIADLTIPPYTDAGRVTIIAVEAGSLGNLPQTAIASYDDVRRVRRIALIEPTKNGDDGESEQDWKDRIYRLLRRRDTLISEDDFEEEVRTFLGVGSTALAIGRLREDKTRYANGYVGVFGLNPDGSPLNSAQIAQLGGYLNNKAAMATISLWSIELFNISVSVVAGFIAGSNPQALSTEINRVLRAYLKPGNLTPGKAILNKALELRVQQISGIQEGVVSVEINGLAQPQALPNLWTVANLTALTVALTSSDGQGQQFTYNF